MNSIDISHVPSPDPDKLWRFELFGAPQTICISPFVSLEVARTLIDPMPRVGAYCKMRVQFPSSDVPVTLKDWLWLDMPCVALRTSDNEPLITFTLRSVNPVKIQVTAHPSAQHISKQPS